jgi:hypothetical protein
MNILNGYKTYIAAGIALIVGILGYLGISVPGYEVEPGLLINAALGLLGVRSAMSK